jgi:putative transposase
MPTPARPAIAHHVYRVTPAGTAAPDPEADDLRYPAFRRLLRRARRDGPVDVYAWCLLPHRWHLVVPPEAVRALSAYLPRHLPRRFVNVPIADERQLAVALLYVEAVPLRAHLVDRAERWRWSSLNERLAPRRDGDRVVSDGPWTLPPNWVEIVNELGREARPHT